MGSEARKGGKVTEEVGVGEPNDTRIAAERECCRGRDQGASGTKDYQRATEGVEALSLKLKQPRLRHIRCRIAAEIGGVTLVVP